MIVGLAGPCNPRALAHHLHPEDAARSWPCGNGLPVEGLADALIRHGHRVVIYTLDEQCREPLRLSGPSLAIHIGPYRPRHRMRDGFAAERRALVAMMRAEPPEILNAHWSYEHALAAMEADVAPVVVTIHDWAPAVLRSQFTPYRMGRLVMHAVAMAKCSRLVAVSPYVAAKTKAWFRRSCQVIANGIVTEATAPRPRSFPPGPPVLVAANQGFSRFKNISRLLQDFPLVREVFPEARLRLLGYGFEPGGAAEQWAAARELCDGIDFVGQIPAPEVLKEFAAAHMMVHPSLVEACPMVMIEAMGQGTPVVGAAEASASAWMLGQGANGVLAQARRPGSIAQACIALLSDPKTWERTGRAGWDAVRTRFTMDRVVEEYLALYRSVLAS
ncbi:glycosyltransferase family 4 protein [Paramagnetospirillum magneticum]|uniref:Glycosyltransferase n=1 Tax=Paramagnetospirillum magneticum (strain ATCC 700264 / AMB-1) TaxID=342108 RepID=Q2W7D3_PARM1|nr:glycosyltransferase family 4 protein [Paramagnetospirillum magneticum]BAE50242.1 Glycosyltransferase [Paramagnetospirillum magneticum AMB-1]